MPFLKLSNGALLKVGRGWFRSATYGLKHQALKYHIQCTTWRDKKQVMFLHSYLVRPSKDGVVLRHVHGAVERLPIKGPSVQKDYAQYYSGVDRNDRDSAENTVSICTSRWYLRVFLWLIDRVIFSVYNIVIFIAKSGLRNEWSKYYIKNGGRKIFQVDLALELMERGIRMDWEAPYDENTKPDWMRKNIHAM